MFINSTTNPEISRLLLEKEKIEQQLLEAICADQTLSKLERLQLIEMSSMFETHSFLQHPIREKYQEQLKEEAIRKGATYFINDDWPMIENDYRNRGELISLPTELLCAYENMSDEDEIAVLKDRSTGAEIKIGYEQLESDVYDWCIKNKTIGFHFDW